jgi:hypothetical protein
MVKIFQTGLLKLNFETRPKKTHFPVFAKNFRRPWMKLKKICCQFPNPWALRVSGMGGYTSKCEKKSKSLHPTLQHVCDDPFCIFFNTSLSSFCLWSVHSPYKSKKFENLGKLRNQAGGLYS